MKKLMTVTLFAALSSVGVANAAPVYTFVGSWEVDQGPKWYESPPNGPVAYTGQEAAALLFGGVASSYVISTISKDVSEINFSSWYSILRYGSLVEADDYSSKYLGQYYGPTAGVANGDPSGSASAYVDDNAIGDKFTNYAFVVSGLSAVPLPASAPLFGAAVLTLGAFGCGMRRRNRAATRNPLLPISRI